VRVLSITRRSGGIGRAGRGEVPRQQVSDKVHGVLGNARQDPTQVHFGIESVEFRGADQAVDGSGPLSAGIGTGEQVVLPLMKKICIVED